MRQPMRETPATCVKLTHGEELEPLYSITLPVEWQMLSVLLAAVCGVGSTRHHKTICFRFMPGSELADARKALL